MTQINFPANPATGDIKAAENGLQYSFDGVKWVSQGAYATGVQDIVKLDSISSQFNGVNNSFNLTTAGGSLVFPLNAESLIISLGGVIQEPQVAYTVDTETGVITFASAPAANTTFYGIIHSRLSMSSASVTLGDGAVTNAKVNTTAAIDASKLSFTQTGTGAAARTIDSKLKDFISVKDFGAVGNGTTDDTTAIQAAITYAADTRSGATVFLPAGQYLITDVIRLYGGVTLQGDTSGDIYGLHENIAGTPRGTEILLSTTLPTARVWTDIGSAGTAVGTLDTSTTYRVGVAAIGKSLTIRDLAIQSGGSSDGTGCWDILLFTGGATRFSMENVELRGYTNKAGWYADATWGASQSGGVTPLTQYHIDNYGWTFVPGRNNNEMTLKDCMIQAGQWGIYMKGSERTAITSSNSIYSYGGFSDLACFGVRVGNKPTGTAGSYDRNSGSYYRDLIENFQNRYWYGCSFRSTSGNAIYLDRGREEYFIGCYGESRADRVAGIAKTYTVDTLAVVDKIHQGRWDSNNPREHRIYLSQSTRIDPLTDGVGRNVWSAITGSTVTAFSYGFDSSVNHPYISVNDSDLTGTISAGQTLTQATDAGLGLHLYATDRAEKTLVLGQSSFQYGNPTQHNFIGLNSVNFTGNFRTEGLETTGSKTYLGAEDTVDINCEKGTQLNLYLNKFLTNGATQSRIRFTTDGLEPYTDLNANLSLGQSDRKWKDVYALNVNGTTFTGTTGNITTVNGTTVNIASKGSLKLSASEPDSNNDGKIVIDGEANHTGLLFHASDVRPRDNGVVVDNSIDLGDGSARFDDIFATNTTISTSDENEKQDIRDATDAEKKVAVAIKSLFKMFKWKSAVTAKGDDARLHFGVIAQNVETAFKNEGLDPEKYALFCKDTWTDNDGNEQVRLGVRYCELLAFVISTL